MLSFGDPCPFAQAIKSDRFDCAAVVSNDSDLEFALTIAKLRRHKKVFLSTPGAPTRVPVGRLTRWAHKKSAIDPSLLAACQLPNPIPQTTLVPVHLRAAHATDGFSAGQSILMQQHVASRSGAICRYADGLVRGKIDAYGCDEQVRRQQS
jgi:hypothetical protein